MADLAKLVVALEMETARYSAELDKAKRQLGKFESGVNSSVRKIATAAGAAAVAAAVGFVALTKAAIDNADGLNDLSKSTGISVESLSQLQYAAQQSGTSLEELTAGFRKLNSNALDAAKGVKGPSEAFDQLNISAKNADGSLKSTEELLLQIADVFSQYEDGAAKAAIAQDLFGKSGAALIPFLNNGRAGVEALKKEADALGLTISGKTAAAADEFNDNINKLKSSAMGLANQVAQQLLPMFQNLSGEFSTSATQGERFAEAARVIATGFKLLVSGALIVGELFDRLGTAIGGAAAAFMAVARGDFTEAFGIIKSGMSDTVSSVSKTASQIAAVWDDSGKNIIAAAEKTDAALKKSFSFGGNKSAVEEVEVTGVAKIDTSATDKINEELQAMTRTQEENAIKSFREQKVALEDLWRSGAISAEQYDARLKEMQDTLLPEFEVTVKKVQEGTEKSYDEFTKRLRKNTQDILGDGIYDVVKNGLDKGIKGALQSFGDMLLQMAAQAVAANIASKIFGTDSSSSGGTDWLSAIGSIFKTESSSGSGGSGGGTDWLSTIGSAVGAFFGGTMDSGGRGQPGKAYAIGTGAQPEWFVPDTAGTFIPQGMMGGTQITQNFAIQAPQGSVSRQTELQIGAQASRGLTTANRRNNR